MFFPVKSTLEEIDELYQEISEEESMNDINITDESESEHSDLSRYHFSQDSEQREIEEQ